MSMAFDINPRWGEDSVVSRYLPPWLSLSFGPRGPPNQIGCGCLFIASQLWIAQRRGFTVSDQRACPATHSADRAARQALPLESTIGRGRGYSAKWTILSRAGCRLLNLPNDRDGRVDQEAAARIMMDPNRELSSKSGFSSRLTQSKG